MGPSAAATLTDVNAEYTPNQVADLLATDEIQLIDVREPDEYAAGRIAGAHLIPMSRLPAEADDLDPEQPVVFYCRSGSRSAMATCSGSAPTDRGSRFTSSRARRLTMLRRERPSCGGRRPRSG